ncbi:MAG: hypothetical protein U0324_20250 [Polyangiales bacterium]
MSLRALLLLAALATPLTAFAQTWSAPVFPPLPGATTRAERWPVGPGMVAERVFSCAPAWQPGVGCIPAGWRPVGFVFGPRPDLVRARAFSGDGRGRVIASTDRDVIYSDDRGRTWQRAAFNGVNRPQLFALDPETRFGVAVAEGAIHVTEDGGVSWRFVRELPSRRIVQAVVQGRNAVFGDGAGGLWAVVQGGDVQVLSDSANARGLAQLQVADGAIVASDPEGRVTRVMANGSVERDASPLRWGR